MQDDGSSLDSLSDIASTAQGAELDLARKLEMLQRILMLEGAHKVIEDRLEHRIETKAAEV